MDAPPTSKMIGLLLGKLILIVSLLVYSPFCPLPVLFSIILSWSLSTGHRSAVKNSVFVQWKAFHDVNLGPDYDNDSSFQSTMHTLNSESGSINVIPQSQSANNKDRI